jgi:hypothetical protein
MCTLTFSLLLNILVCDIVLFEAKGYLVFVRIEVSMMVLVNVTVFRIILRRWRQYILPEYWKLYPRIHTRKN